MSTNERALKRTCLFIKLSVLGWLLLVFEIMNLSGSAIQNMCTLRKIRLAVVYVEGAEPLIGNPSQMLLVGTWLLNSDQGWKAGSLGMVEGDLRILLGDCLPITIEVFWYYIDQYCHVSESWPHISLLRDFSRSPTTFQMKHVIFIWSCGWDYFESPYIIFFPIKVVVSCLTYFLSPYSFFNPLQLVFLLDTPRKQFLSRSPGTCV